MSREFNIHQYLQDLIGYKGIPYPGGWFGKFEKNTDVGANFPGIKSESQKKELSDLGTRLRKKDLAGRWYFMPVVFIHKGKEYEIPHAVISIKGKKNIVETTMVGRKGTVKELISIDDYEINIAGVIIDNDDFPENGLKELNELYSINESIQLKCVLTDVFLEEEDRVVITEMELPEIKAVENARAIKIACKSDRSFELIID